MNPFIVLYYLIKKPSILHIHTWKEFGESNSRFEDKVFYCETCGKIGFPNI